MTSGLVESLESSINRHTLRQDVRQHTCGSNPLHFHHGEFPPPIFTTMKSIMVCRSFDTDPVFCERYESDVASVTIIPRILNRDRQSVPTVEVQRCCHSSRFCSQRFSRSHCASRCYSIRPWVVNFWFMFDTASSDRCDEYSMTSLLFALLHKKLQMRLAPPGFTKLNGPKNWNGLETPSL